MKKRKSIKNKKKTEFLFCNCQKEKLFYPLMIALLLMLSLTAVVMVRGATTIENPIGTEGLVDTLKLALNVLKGVVGTAAVIAFIVGGIFYITSGGNEEWAKKGKTIMTFATIGLIIALMAPALVDEITRIINPDTAGGSRSVLDVANSLLNLVLICLASISVLSFILAGITYFRAVGNEEMVKKAKSQLVYSVIGVIISLGALVIVRQIAILLGANV